MEPIKLPISAIVVGCNESHLLENCLKSLKFCNELIYIDLESQDNSISKARKYVSQIIERERVPIVEIIHAQIQNITKYKWILF